MNLIQGMLRISALKPLPRIDASSAAISNAKTRLDLAVSSLKDTARAVGEDFKKNQEPKRVRQ